MRNAYRLVLISLILAASILLMMSEEAEANGWLELNRAGFEYGRFINDGQDVLIYPRKHKDVINLKLDMDVLSFLYWNNTLMGMTDTGQFRAVSWEYQLGLRVSDMLSVQYKHRSQHILDAVQPYLPTFPLEDSVGVSLKVYSSPNPRRSIF